MLARLIVLATVLLGIAACGGEPAQAPESAAAPTRTAQPVPILPAPAAEPEPAKYKQTWATPYSETTCAQFAEAMNDHERFVMAADMLVGARGDNNLPSDHDVRSFQDDVTIGCEPVPDEPVTDVATATALIRGERAG